MTIETNTPAPDFCAAATGGRTLSLADFAGQTLVLYFYPRDNTPGCTQEGEAFRDQYDDFRAAGAAVVGVSRDSVRKHENFKAKYAFPFDLIADSDETLCNAYGVLKEKNLYGKKHIGIERSTFLIDGEGLVRGVWRGVKVPGHAGEVLDSIRELQSAVP